MPNGCSNDILENQAKVIQIYVMFTFSREIQMKQFFFHIAYCIDIWKPVCSS